MIEIEVEVRNFLFKERNVKKAILFGANRKYCGQQMDQDP